MDALGYDTLWLAEHHFQHEGYECMPNILMLAVHLAHVTKQTQDRLRLQHRADVAPAAPGRGFRDRRHPDQGPHRVRRRARLSHAARSRPSARRCSTRTPIASCSRSRSRSSSRRSTTRCFSHKGKHYTLPPEVPYRGYQLKELTLVPRPVNRPVECWQPIVSASPRGLDFMVKHGIKGAVGGGAATMQAGPIQAYQDAAARAGKHLKLGENLQLGLHFYLAKTREQAVREITPIYEEHVKMFAPLGFVPGLTPEQVAAVARRGGWDAAGVPTVEHYHGARLLVRRHAGRPRRAS